MATEFQTAERENYVQDLLSSIAPEWHSEFQRFVETGEAEESFFKYLDESPVAQDAVETAFNRQAAQFESLAAELQKRQEQASSDLGHSSEQSQTSAKLAAVVEVAMQTPSIGVPPNCVSPRISAEGADKPIRSRLNFFM